MRRLCAMKRFTILCLVAVLVGHATLILRAQTSTPNGITLPIGEHVLVIATDLPVYTHPDDTGPIFHELIRGMTSRVLKIQADQNGDQWLYLSDNVHGWVHGAVDNQPSVVTY